MTTCYIPRESLLVRACWAARTFIRTNRMRLRQLRAALTPLGWGALTAIVFLFVALIIAGIFA